MTKDELQSIFDYRDDGVLTWKRHVGGRATVGSEAGTEDALGYKTINYRRKQFRYHKLVYAWHTGEWPVEIDHINRDRGDNRIENLRPITHSDNVANSDFIRSSTGVRGVSKLGKYDRYVARIRKNGKAIHLGVFPTIEEARVAYEEGRHKYFPNVFAV